MNKKRKFQAEQLGFPPKHKCWVRTFECDSCGSPSNANAEADIYACIIKEKTEGLDRDDEMGLDSAKGSNDIPADADSVLSSHDQPSTSSVNWGLLTKSGDDRGKSVYIDGEHNFPCQGIGLNASLNYEEHLRELGNQMDHSFSDYRNESNDSIEQCTDKELEDLLYSSGVNPNNYVLSSGRWDVSQETRPSTKKLTIDKEFEQYFSMLML